MGDNGTCIEKRLVVGELLSFVAYKLKSMAPDTITQLCSSFYSDEAVDNAKAHLYERCADSADKPSTKRQRWAIMERVSRNVLSSMNFRAS